MDYTKLTGIQGKSSVRTAIKSLCTGCNLDCLFHFFQRRPLFSLFISSVTYEVSEDTTANINQGRTGNGTAKILIKHRDHWHILGLPRYEMYCQSYLKCSLIPTSKMRVEIKMNISSTRFGFVSLHWLIKAKIKWLPFYRGHSHFCVFRYVVLSLYFHVILLKKSINNKSALDRKFDHKCCFPHQWGLTALMRHDIF